MNAVGPAMSLRTSCWLFPQNEQKRVCGDAGSLSSETDGVRSSLGAGSVASILADKMFQFSQPNAFAINSRASACVVSIALAFRASRRARAIVFASRKLRMTAPLHRRTEKIGACVADPFANDEAAEEIDKFTISGGRRRGV